MAALNKEQRVIFKEVFTGFKDNLIVSGLVKYKTFDATDLERSNNVVWRPNQYIMPSSTGTDATSNFISPTQTAVPAVVDTNQYVGFQLSDTEMRDMAQDGSLRKAAGEKLASDVNVAILRALSLQAVDFQKRSGTATGYRDVAAAMKSLNFTGVPMARRRFAASPQDWYEMSANLQDLSRSFGNKISDNALENAEIGRLAGCNMYMLDYAFTQAAAGGGGGITVDNRYTGGGNGIWHTPTNMTASGGLSSNFDNRYKVITVSSTTNVAVGDWFTIANVFKVHRINKVRQPELLRFRVMEVLNATQLRVSMPPVNSAGTSAAEQQYANAALVGAGSATAAIVFLNTVEAPINCYWHEDAIELLCGTIAAPTDAGVQVGQASTPQGLQLTMLRAYDINTRQVKTRFDVFFGVCVNQPDMVGGEMFSQT